MTCSFIVLTSKPTQLTSPLITYGISAQRVMTTTTSAGTQKDPSCDNLYAGPNLWNHTYNHKRFNTYSPDCITVSGTVLSALPPSMPGGEADGDFHINILANTAKYSNSNNCKAPQPGGCRELIMEIICYDHSAITLDDAKKSCAGYKNDIRGPQRGENVTVTGKWSKK